VHGQGAAADQVDDDNAQAQPGSMPEMKAFLVIASSVSIAFASCCEYVGQLSRRKLSSPRQMASRNQKSLVQEASAKHQLVDGVVGATTAPATK
jgi:hypothetical protein